MVSITCPKWVSSDYRDQLPLPVHLSGDCRFFRRPRGFCSRLVPGDQQALLQEATDGLDPTRRASPPADPDVRVKRRLGSDLPGVVSGLPCCSPADGGVTPRNQILSLHTAVGGDLKGKMSPVLYVMAIPAAFLS